MKYLSFKINDEIKDKIINFYQNQQKENSNQYIIFFAEGEDFTVAIYQGKKGYKVVFGGVNAAYEASLFSLTDFSPKKEMNSQRDGYVDLSSQIGSDEVGWGDFFGPLVVAACYFDEKYLSIIDKIKDSKKLTDNFILSFIPTIKDKLIYSLLVVDNDKLNQLIAQGFNMNKIKAYLHNQVQYNLSQKIKSKSHYIDQFCEERTYYNYLKDVKNIVRNITFHTKGESYYPSVALASMLARYQFLQKMQTLSEKYEMDIPFGASEKVDDFAKTFIERCSLEELSHVAKTNFANYEKIKGSK